MNGLAKLQSETFSLESVEFAELAGFDADDALEAWWLFRKSCAHLSQSLKPLRAAKQADQELIAFYERVAASPLPNSRSQADRIWKDLFAPHRVVPQSGSANGSGFLTGYYEPVVSGSLTRTREFTEPVRGRPTDLISAPNFSHFETAGEVLHAGRHAENGLLEAYPDRQAIESGVIDKQCKPVVWLRDAVEVFMMQVQGSGRVRLPDGSTKRLIYAGRNGRPYTSIGQILIREGHIRPDQMSLESLKNWVRTSGQEFDAPGRRLLWRNQSYVFFELSDQIAAADGPIGGQGLSLTPLRSIAIDRNIWPYGLPFWIDAELPWKSTEPEPFQRLMIAQDTGSAILGPARFDLFFGSGDSAGVLAAQIRHDCSAYVLLPRMGDSR